MKKLSLDDFKQIAENVQPQEIMQQIEGGAWSDCHGFWGQLRKFALDAIDRMTD
ncbi:hypothetical protein [Flavobacterium sp.]|jgi:hypothetical protein|uniref:hypothetical protein n=1 Tax=Flavobacterium sp. TaxID=239 RepID=UPI0037C18AE0